MVFLKLSENQMFPSGPEAMPVIPLGRVNSGNSPVGVTRPILLHGDSPNQRLPSAPAVISVVGQELGGSGVVAATRSLGVKVEGGYSGLMRAT